MATLKDVAAQAGVSLSTASIVAKGQGDARKISAATQARVRDAMADLGYVPNAAARRLRGKNERKNIALFWADDFREAMLARFLQGLHAAAAAYGTDVDISVYIYRAGELANAPALQGAPVFNAAIVANANASDLTFLAEFKPLVPTVLYNRRLEGYSSAAVSDSEIGQLAASEVFRFMESRKSFDIVFADLLSSADAEPAVAYLSAPYAFEGMKLREQAFVEELELSGIWAERVPIDGNSAEDGKAITDELLAHGFRVVFTPSDSVALGVLHACYQRGIRVPDRLGVISVGNGLPEYAANACPSLTCVEIPMEQMAGECLELALRRMEGTGAFCEQRDVSALPVCRASL